MNPADPAATFCATLVDEWVRRGLAHAVIAPGSRSTPLTLALAARHELSVHVVHDERSAAFIALGLGLSDTPAVLVCTSGSAGANCAPAVVEAGLSDVPMVILTADRPPESHDVGAAQTIDQHGLFGGAVRWFHDPGVPTIAAAGTWRSLGRRVWSRAVGSHPGPVHVNLPFREPLLGVSGELTPPLPPLGARIDTSPPVVEVAAFDTGRGLIVAGGRSGVAPESIAALADSTGWPVLADPTSGAGALDSAVTYADSLLRHRGFAADHAPDLIVRFGRPPASRVVNEWLAASGAPIVQVGGPGVIDPDYHVVADVPAAAAPALAAVWRGGPGTTWAAGWRRAQERADAAIAALLAAEPVLTEPAVARTVATTVVGGRAGGPGDEMELVVASSMPVRDLEWYGGPGVRAHANRGANGIDGVVSTALGRALTGRAVTVVVGDVAFLHDGGALTALAGRDADLRIVVVDNDGGGIFSFLPQAASLAPDVFERLFGTPHGTDLLALGRAHGLDTATVAGVSELVERLAIPGPTVTIVRTDRAANVEVHRRLNAAVAATLG
ncbi:MAG: 2-succinyl-5-enolpyruvyl-6-hydroxy-3-cyclohexene-1-carboxylic-acid synthase [Desertimonas sp.]